MSVIPATWEIETRRIKLEASPGRNFMRPNLNNNITLGLVVLTCHTSYIGIMRKITLQAVQRKT
jgi:hypothetical protein